ncbi:MAG: FecR domain-containing protein [Candidatus Eiseniibacteriota bacterium]
MAALGVVLPGAAWAQAVGTVNLIKTAAYERLESTDWEELLVQDNVFSNQRVRTPSDAALHVVFADGTDFRLGADSEAVIDSYVYDPASGTGKAVTTLGKGVFRFISGKVKDHTIVTPTATLGIRGTDFYVLVADVTGVLVKSGSVQMRPECNRRDIGSARNRGAGAFLNQPFLISQGKAAGVYLGDCFVTPDVTLNIADRGLDDDGGIDPGAGRNNGPINLNLQFPGNDCLPGRPNCNRILTENNQTTSPITIITPPPTGGSDETPSTPNQ